MRFFPSHSPRALASLACALTIAVAGCKSDPPAPPPPAKASLTVAPAALEFGLLLPGTEKSLDLTLKNAGNAKLVVASHEVQKDTRGAFAVDAFPAELAAGAEATVKVAYRAGAGESADTATLVLATNADGQPSTSIALTGRTAPPTCTDGRQDGDETAVDCGGKCPGCGTGLACGVAKDCASGLACVGGLCGVCSAATECRDGEICEAGRCAGCTSDAQCADGSTCDAGACRVCPGASGKIDTKVDPANCGACGHVCETPAHSAATCAAGRCGRGPCETGYFDFDGATTLGCETHCEGRTCTGPGGEVHLDTEPIPERSLGLRGFASGSSFGGAVQTSTRFTNTGVLGESEPPPAGGATELRGPHFILQGGVNAQTR